MTNSTDFYVGVFVGFLAAGAVGFLLQQINFLFKRVRAADKPQTVVQKTDKTPNQVVASSARAGCWLFLLIVGVIAICVVTFMIVG